MLIKRIDTTAPEYGSVLDLREEVLRRPLGLSLRDEDLSGEAAEIILAAMDGDEVIGCVLLQPKDLDILKLRQMAVAPTWQGKGIGRRLVAAAEETAWLHGYGRIELHAREVAAAFYRKLGYRQEGGLFTEVGIPHLLMQKDRP